MDKKNDSIGTMGARIREERERLGFTQTAFAALAQASKRSQIGWEQSRSSPPAPVLAAWHGVGADTDFIVSGLRTDPVTRELNRLESLVTDHPKDRAADVADALRALRQKASELQQQRIDLMLQYLGDDEAAARRRARIQAMAADRVCSKEEAARVLAGMGWRQPPAAASIIAETLWSEGLTEDLIVFVLRAVRQMAE